MTCDLLHAITSAGNFRSRDEAAQFLGSSGISDCKLITATHTHTHTHTHTSDSNHSYRCTRDVTSLLRTKIFGYYQKTNQSYPPP